MDVNAKNSRGHTPLFCAAGKGNKVMAKLLLATGQADVDAKEMRVIHH